MFYPPLGKDIETHIMVFTGILQIWEPEVMCILFSFPEK